MSNVLTMWKQRSHEGQAPRVALDENLPSALTEDRSNLVGLSTKNKFKTESVTSKENVTTTSGFATNSAIQTGGESEDGHRPVSSSFSGTLKGVIRGSGIGVIKSDTLYAGSSGSASTPLHAAASTAASSQLTNIDASTAPTPFRTDPSSLGSYGSAGTGKRRFSEMPQQAPLPNKDQTTYRDRAAERRNLYGSSSSFGEDLSQLGAGDSSKLTFNR